MNRKTLKELTKQMEELDEAERIGVYDDFSDVQLSFFSIEDMKELDKESTFTFQLPSKRVDNNKTITYRMISYNELNKLGVPVSVLDRILEVGVRKNKHKNLKRKLENIKEKHKRLPKVKKYYINDKREYSDAFTILNSLRKNPKLFGERMRKAYKEDPMPITQFIRLKKATLNKVPMVFKTVRSDYMKPYYVNVPINNKNKKWVFYYVTFLKPVKCLNKF